MRNSLARRQELESLFKKYSYVPKEAVVQIDVQRCGLDFSEEALQKLEPYASKTYNLFTFDRVSHDDLKSKAYLKVPDQIGYTGGMYGLRGIVKTSEVRLNPSSEYIIDVVDGDLKLCTKEKDERVPIADVLNPHPLPRYMSKKFDDGTSYSAVCDAQPGKSFSRVVPLRMCQFWGYKEECKFCDMNNAARMQTKMGRRAEGRKMVEDLSQVAEVFKEVYLREKWPPGLKPRSILMTGGVVLAKIDGMNEDDFYLRYVKAIKEAIGNRWPICLQTDPKEHDVAVKYRDAGVDAHETNLEIWDKQLFSIICPGKSKRFGWDKWVKLMFEEVDVFGEGNVTPAFVSGVEMCQPWGFKTIDEAVKSTTEGYEFLMRHGVVPRPSQWNISAFSALKDNVPPPLEFYVRMDWNWYDIWRKYGLPPVRRFNLLGPGKEHSERGWLSMGC